MVNSIVTEDLVFLHSVDSTQSYALSILKNRDSENFPLQASLTENVISFDFKSIDGTYYLYAVEKLETGKFKLVQTILTMSITSKNVKTYSPSTKGYDTTNCGSVTKVTHDLVILSCPSYQMNKGVISIYLRYDLSLIYEING